MKNKKKRKSFRVANVILTIVLILLLRVMAFIIFLCHVYKKYEVDDQKYYAEPVMTGEVIVECIGKEYEQQSKEGYTYYRLEFPVTNTGTDEFDWVLVDPAEDTSYTDYESFYSENSFHYVDKKIVPPSQEGIAETIIAVKDELDSLDVICYLGIQDYNTKKNPYEMTIQLK